MMAIKSSEEKDRKLKYLRSRAGGYYIFESGANWLKIVMEYMGGNYDRLYDDDLAEKVEDYVREKLQIIHVNASVRRGIRREIKRLRDYGIPELEFIHEGLKKDAKLKHAK